MKNILFFFLLISSTSRVAAQQARPVAMVSLVKILDNKKAEALFFYENNWKVYRETALQKGYIQSYQLLFSQEDSTVNFDMIMVTTFKDSIQFSRGEENFGTIIKSLRTNGPLLLNDLKPDSFRKLVTGNNMKQLYPD